MLTKTKGPHRTISGGGFLYVRERNEGKLREILGYSKKISYLCHQNNTYITDTR